MGNSRKLDALRGGASLVVLVGHLAQVFAWRLVGNDHWLAVAASTLARHAVLVFFLLSGYLITGSIAANVRRNGVFRPGEYLAARIARIYPPLIGALALCGLVFWIVGPGQPGPADGLYHVRTEYGFTLSEAWRAITMQPQAMSIANGPLWSLYIEARLYVVAALVALGMTTRGRWFWLAAAIVWLRADLADYTEYGLCAIAWGMGALAQSRHRFVPLVYIALLPVAMWFAPGGLWQLCACAVYAYLIFWRPEGANPPRWLAASADYSYSLYVTHFPLLILCLSLGAPWLGTWGGTLAVASVSGAACIAFAWAFAKAFERTADFKRWARSALTLRAASAPAASPFRPPASRAASGRPPSPR